MAFNFNFGNLSSFGLEPIDVKAAAPAPLSQAELVASASRAASSPILQGDSSQFVGPPSPQPSTFETVNITPQVKGALSVVTPTLSNLFGPRSQVSTPSLVSTQTYDPASYGPTYEDLVSGAYQQVLDRPRTAEETFYVDALRAGTLSPQDLYNAIAYGASGSDVEKAQRFLRPTTEPETLPYQSLLSPAEDTAGFIETFNEQARDRDFSSVQSWEDIPNVTQEEIQAAQDAGYKTPGAYLLAKAQSTDPALAEWRESFRDQVFGDKTFRQEFGDLFAKPIDRDAEENIYKELETQYNLAKEQGGYKYKNESDLDEIWRSQAAKLAAGGVKSIYEIDVRETPQFETYTDVQKFGNNYYVVTREENTGNEIKTQIDPSKITEIEERAIPVFDSESNRFLDDEIRYDITVEKDPVKELVNKNTGDPVYDVILKGNWREDPNSYRFRGNETVDVEKRKGYDRIGYNTAVRDMADMVFMRTDEGLPVILPAWKSTKSDLTPVALAIAAFAGPYAMQIGSAFGATTAASQAMVGAGVISGGTQLALTGKIDPGALAVSVATAGIMQTGGLTGADIAADAAQLAEQGLSAAQITDTLAATGVNTVTANLAGNFAAVGVPVELAPAITAGTTNMGLAGLQSLATDGTLDPDALTRGFVTGAAGGVSEVAVEKIVGTDRIASLSQDLGLTPEQTTSVLTSGLVTGLNAEITGTGNFVDELAQSLVVNGASFATANKIAKELDGVTSSKGRAALVSASQEIVKVAGNAAFDGIDVGSAIENMAPIIIGKAVSSYVRTPEEKAKETETGQITQTQKPSEDQIKKQLDDNLIYDGRNAKSVDEASQGAIQSGYNTFVYDGKTYTISPKTTSVETPATEEQIKKQLDENLVYDGRNAKSVNDAAQGAIKEGFNTFVHNGKTYTIPSQEEVRKNVNIEIAGKETFGEAYNLARDKLGPNQTFEWRGKSYSTATAEERPDLVTTKPGDYTQTDTGAVPYKGVQEVSGATDPTQINVENKDDNESVARYISDKFFNGAFTDVKAEDIPIIGGLFKTIAKNQGIGLDGLGNQIKDFSSAYSLASGTPFKTTVTQIGDGLINLGKELGSEDYLKEINGFQKDYIDLSTKPRPDGLGKSNWDRFVDWTTIAKKNPVGAAGSVLYEIGQEFIPLAAASTTLLMLPASVGVGAGLTVAAAVSATSDALEVFGNSGKDRYDYGIKKGESDDVARTNAIMEAGANSIITLGTEFLADKAFMGVYVGGLKTSIATGLGASKAVAVNWAQEYVESWGHAANTAAQRGIELDPNVQKSASMLEAMVAGKTTATLTTPAVVYSVAIGVNENGEDITLEDIRSGNETLATPKMDAPVNITEAGDSLTLGGLTAIMQQNDVPVDFELTSDTPVFERADGTVVTFDDLQFESSINDESFAEVITRLSDNQIVIPAEFNNPVLVAPTSQDANVISAAKAGSITIDSSQDVDSDTGVTVTETVDVTQNKDVGINPDVTPDINANPAIETTIVSNPDTNQETKIEVVTDPDNNVTQVVATEINDNIKVDVSEPYNEIIQKLIDEGNTPEEAKEKAKVPVKNAVSKGSSLNAFAPPFGASKIDDIVAEFRNLRTTGKRKFESPLEAFLRKSRGEPEVEAEKVTAEKKEPTMDYYSYGKPSEIDEILGTVEEYGVGPNVQFPELGQMAPQFGMRKGGLVPAFADGGPLTMAAGKLRRDYREGDAVEGPGDGQSDDIPAMLADGEFVIPADVVAALGNGSNKAGADKLYEMMHNIRRDYRKAKPKDLPKPAKSPLSYISRRT